MHIKKKTLYKEINIITNGGLPTFGQLQSASMRIMLPKKETEDSSEDSGLSERQHLEISLNKIAIMPFNHPTVRHKILQKFFSCTKSFLILLVSNSDV